MSGTASDVCDVVVVGGGIVGCAIARALAGTNLSVTLLEARDDVGDGTSKANTALLHTGYDASPGTLESRLVARGYELLGDYAEQTGIPVERTGALLVAWTDEERDALPGLKDKAERNFYHHCEIVTADEVYRRVPDLGPGVLAGLTVPGESIICTWTTNLALATDAVARGARLLRGARVTGAVTGDGHTTLQTTRGDVRGRWVINAAGLGADYLDAEFGHHRFTVTPRRGELLVFDKLTRPMVPCIVLAVPSSRGKGVLVSPTIYGNVMVGPTSENLEDRTATGTSEEGFEFLLVQGPRADAVAVRRGDHRHLCRTARSDRPRRVVSIAEIALRPEYLAGGGVEQDPEALFDSVVEAGRRALAQAGVPMSAVALANQGETVLAWDRATGRPLTPAIVWQDRRAESICAALTASRRHRSPQRTGLVLDPYFSAPKMAWIRANLTTRRRGHHHRHLADPPAVRRVRHRRLDGQPVPADRTRRRRLGRRAARPVRPDRRSAARDRRLRRDRRAAQMSSGRPIPVAGLIVDQQAALLAESCLEPGDRQVHLRHRRVPARPARRQRRRARRRA